MLLGMTNIIEKYSMQNSPVPLPTLEELYRAIDNPEGADGKLKRYIELRPAMVENLKSIRGILTGNE